MIEFPRFPQRLALISIFLSHLQVLEGLLNEDEMLRELTLDTLEALFSEAGHPDEGPLLEALTVLQKAEDVSIQDLATQAIGVLNANR